MSKTNLLHRGKKVTFRLTEDNYLRLLTEQLRRNPISGSDQSFADILNDQTHLLPNPLPGLKMPKIQKRGPAKKAAFNAVHYPADKLRREIMETGAPRKFPKAASA